MVIRFVNRIYSNIYFVKFKRPLYGGGLPQLEVGMAAQMSSDTIGLELRGATLPGQGDLLTPAALAFLGELHRRY